MSLDVQNETSTVGRRRASAELASSPHKRSGTGSWKKILLLVIGAGVVLAAVVVGLRQTDGAKDRSNSPKHTITRGTLVVSVSEEGTLESSSNEEIKCKVKGGSTVLSVVESGTVVKPGDELVRLDTSTIEDNISSQKIVYETALANKITAESDVAVAKISITEYIDGTFVSELTTLEKDLVIAQSNLKSSKNSLVHGEKMFRRGYISKLEREALEDAVEHAKLEVKVKQTDIDVLEKYTKAKTMQEKNSLFEIAEARLAAETASLELEESRLERAEEQLKNCVILAKVGGMVIFPSAAEWKEQPDIEEGATVREDQVLLIIPDLEQMQVKFGVHESKVDRLKIGMEAQIQIQNGIIKGKVFSIASITKPTGWWNGNVVKYDTVIRLDGHQGLKPGMSVAVEVFLAKHENVLTIPVAAVDEIGGEFVCWVETAEGVVKRALQLGDSNDRFIVVEKGLQEGDVVMLSPLDFIDEAQREALKPLEEDKTKLVEVKKYKEKK